MHEASTVNCGRAIMGVVGINSGDLNILQYFPIDLRPLKTPS